MSDEIKLIHAFVDSTPTARESDVVDIVHCDDPARRCDPARQREVVRYVRIIMCSITKMNRTGPYFQSLAEAPKGCRMKCTFS